MRKREGNTLEIRKRERKEHRHNQSQRAVMQNGKALKREKSESELKRQEVKYRYCTDYCTYY